MSMHNDRIHLIEDDRRRDYQYTSVSDNDLNEISNGTVTEVKKSLCERVRDCLKCVTVEPLMFLYLTGISVQSAINTNLILFKVCQEQNFSQDVCRNLSAYPAAQASVQVTTSTLNMYSDLISTLPVVFFVLFFGPWSDKHGRKIPMLFPIIGHLVSAMIYVINAYWIQISSYYMLVAAVPIGITGGSATLFMACMSYIADITNVGTRTVRIALLDFSFVFGPLVGLLSSDKLYQKTGFVGVYGISVIFFLLCAIYGMVRIVDTRGRFSPYHSHMPELSETGNMFLDLFDTENIKDIFKTATKPRPNKGRTKIFLLISVMCALLFSFTSSFDFLYVKLKVGWDYHQYIILSVFQLILDLIGATIVLPVFSIWLKVDDSVLGIIGSVSSVAAYILRGLAQEEIMLCTSYIVGCLGGMKFIVTRSIMSKSVPENDLGKVFSMLAVWEAVIPLAASPIYTEIYNATISTFSGTIYLLSGGINLIIGFAYIWLYVNRKPPSSASHIHEDIPEIQD